MYVLFILPPPRLPTLFSQTTTVILDTHTCRLSAWIYDVIAASPLRIFFTHQLVLFFILLVLEPQLIRPSAILYVKFRFILASAESAPPNDRDLKICSPL